MSDTISADRLKKQWGPRRTADGKRITHNRLREVRESLGLTADAVARRLGTGVSQVLLHEETGGVNIRTAQAYASIYKRKLDALWPPDPREGRP